MPPVINTSAPTRTAPAPSSSPANPAAIRVRQALAAYNNGLSAYVAASNRGSTDTTELSRYVTGSALEVLADGLARQHSKGLISKGTPGIDPPQVTEISPATAPTTVEVSGCLDGTNWLLYKTDGQLADNTPGGRHAVVAQIDKIDDAWKVSGIAIQGVGTC
jgi:hypothetical protein